MVDYKSSPQVLEHLQKSLAWTIFDTKWIPGTSSFVAAGAYARGTGALHVYELGDQELTTVEEKEVRPASIKCCTLGASSLRDPHVATGDFEGKLEIYDLDTMKSTYTVKSAHGAIINCIDGIGGSLRGYGAPEICTGGRDGRVCVWDPRQKDVPVAVFEPKAQQDPGDDDLDKGKAPKPVRDCWTVGFGNSYNDEERCVVAGYDSGDVKIFDLKMNRVRWEGNVGNGVCGVEFDRKEIEMNKFVVACLESKFHVFDARTQHATKGFASAVQEYKTTPSFIAMQNAEEEAKKKEAESASATTVWGVKHLPQNRELMMLLGGDGALNLYKYHYPDQRRVKDDGGEDVGVAGTIELLSTKSMSSQPICSFDWSPDKQGLCCMGSFDQCIRVGFVTKLNKV